MLEMNTQSEPKFG